MTGYWQGIVGRKTGPIAKNLRSFAQKNVHYAQNTIRNTSIVFCGTFTVLTNA